MLKKSKKLENAHQISVESEKLSLGDVKTGENYILSLVVNPVTIKRWNELRLSFSCNTNENFVTKLLDLAQDYLNRNKDNLPLTNRKKTNSNLKKSKNKTENCENSSTAQIESSSSQKPNEKSKNIEAVEKNKTKHEGFKSVSEKFIDNINQNEEEKIVDDDAEKDKKKKIPLLEKTPKKDKAKDFDVRKAPELQVQSVSVKESECDKSSDNLAAIKIKHCHNCNTRHIQDHCPINYPYSIIPDSIDYETWSQKPKELLENLIQSPVKTEAEEVEDRSIYSYAKMSLPKDLFFVQTDTPHGLGVSTNQELQPFTQFGPLIGKPIKEVDIPEDSAMRDIWEIFLESGSIFLNTEDLENSSWLRFVRPAANREERNLTVICKENRLYFVTVRSVKIGEELLYWQDSSVSTSKKKLDRNSCGGCGMTFSHPLYYRTHCSVFHDVRYSLTIRKYHCKVCGAAVLGKENIMKHAAELHNGQGAYQCQFCKKFFLRLNYLEMHRTYGCSANPHRSRPLCDFCGRKFCQPQKLKVHIKRMHSDLSEVLKEFQCKNCQKLLGSRAALQRHMKEVHQKQLDGACSCIRCGKHFQNKSNLKIHMLTHSGIKPFRCAKEDCQAAFTTKQCLQFHYKKVHNYTEENMPKIERSVDYTFQAYSGLREDRVKNEHEKHTEIQDQADVESDIENESLDSKSMDDPPALQSPLEVPEEPSSPKPPLPDSAIPETDNFTNSLNSNMKVLSKGSKKWIGDEPVHPIKTSDFYSIERLSRDTIPVSLQEADMYERNKLSNLTEYNRHEPSNASLLVEAALDSVCSEPNIDIDVGTSPNCTDSLVNNLYTLTHQENLPDVTYNETVGMTESRDLNLMSPSVNEHISVTDDLSNELQHNQNITMDYSSFHQEGFSPATSPCSSQRNNFVKNYINSLSPHNNEYGTKNLSPVPSPPRYDFGHAVNTEHISSDDSNGVAAQNLSLHNTKNDIQLDLSMYKSPYKLDSQSYMRRLKFEGENNGIEHDMDNIGQDLSSNIQESEENRERLKYPDDISAEIRSKFELDLDLRLKNYESMDTETLRQRNSAYENINSELEFRNKSYDLMDSIENRGIENDFRTERNFEPLVLNSSELQGLDMSARSFHNYPNINRYHHIYPEIDRVDLRLNYSPPPPPYTHDLLRVVSLDLTPPGRHSVDLSLRNHPLHQIANSRLLTEHTLQNNHRLLDQSRLLSTDLTSSRLGESRLLSDSTGRILSDHTTNRILGTNDHLLGSEQSRLIGDESRILTEQPRLLDQSRLMGDGRILSSTTANGSVSPVAFPGYAVSQSPYHPTPLAPRPHVTSPTSTPYHHYPSYY